MKNQNDFINEMDDGYIDIESCFDPVFEHLPRQTNI